VARRGGRRQGGEGVARVAGEVASERRPPSERRGSIGEWGEWGWGEEEMVGMAKSPTPLSNGALLGVRHSDA
jgi:hypothetical protein